MKKSVVLLAASAIRLLFSGHAVRNNGATVTHTRHYTELSAAALCRAATAWA